MNKVAHICTSGISHKIMGDKLRLLQRQEGMEVTFISSPEGTDSAVMSSYPFEWKLLPMARSIQPLADMRSIMAMYKLLRKERYDIVHTHTAKAGIIGRVAAKLARVPVIIHTSHGLPFYEGQSKKAFYLYRTLEKVGALCCHSLASQNAEDADVLRKLIPWRNVFMEGNGVDMQRLDKLASQLTAEQLQGLRLVHGIPHNKPVLLMAARFEAVKDHHLLLESLLELKREGLLNWVTVLAGQGPLEDEVKQFLQEQGLEGDVFCIGQQSSIVPWIVMADAVTLTSEKEGIPRSLMESMALGKPVIATDVLGTRELVAHEETGLLVPYRDALSLAEALNKVMNAPADDRRLNDAGRVGNAATVVRDRLSNAVAMDAGAGAGASAGAGAGANASASAGAGASANANAGAGAGAGASANANANANANAGAGAGASVNANAGAGAGAGASANANASAGVGASASASASIDASSARVSRIASAGDIRLNEAGLRSRMGEAGRRRIEAEFTEARVVERLMQLYRTTGRRVSRERRSGARLNAVLKRLLDLVLSVPAALLLLPVYAVVAGLVRLKLGSPVLFKQQRPGRFGNPFHVLKFRTMRDAVDKAGQPLPDEDRMTAFGHLLRKLSLDELPQLFNVIRGDMSLVGPRPLLMEYLPLYTEDQARRHDVRPGITGWAQVNGRNTVSWEDKFKLDTEYVDQQSFWFDIRILAMTVGKVLKRDGISQQGQATVHKFTGNREMGNAS